jgi:hypothetical protein
MNRYRNNFSSLEYLGDQFLGNYKRQNKYHNTVVVKQLHFSRNIQTTIGKQLKLIKTFHTHIYMYIIYIYTDICTYI